MTRRFLLVLSAALLAVAGVVAVVAGAGTSAAVDTAATAVPSAQVVVASGDIPAGTPIDAIRSESLTSTARFPMSTLPSDALVDLGRVGPGSVTTRDIKAREIVVAGALSNDPTVLNSVAGLSLPPGTSAVPVSFQSFPNAKDWSGYIQPGAEIAVYQTFTARDPNADLTPRGDDLKKDDAAAYQVTRLLLDRVKVLAVGNGAASSGDSGSDSTKTAPSMVLALTQAQTEALVMGLGRESHLYPVLLTQGSLVAPSPGTIDTRIFDANPSREPAPKAAP